MVTVMATVTVTVMGKAKLVLKYFILTIVWCFQEMAQV